MITGEFAAEKCGALSNSPGYHCRTREKYPSTVLLVSRWGGDILTDAVIPRVHRIGYFNGSSYKGTS